MSDDRAGEGDDARTMAFGGVVDFLSAPDIQKKAVALLDDGLATLIIDMGKLTFIDSSGLSVLVYLKGRCDERGTALQLHAVPPRARGLIDSLGLSAYFDLPPG